MRVYFSLSILFLILHLTVASSNKIKNRLSKNLKKQSIAKDYKEYLGPKSNTSCPSKPDKKNISSLQKVMPIHDQPCGDGWSQLNNWKCVKILNGIRAMNFCEAKQICEMFKGASLLTIDGDDEQQLLNKLIFKTNQVVDNVWIGARWNKTNQRFEWLDNCPLTYTNWADGKPDNRTCDDCVEMVYDEHSSGKWSNKCCKRTNTVVCSRFRTLDLDEIQSALFELSKTQAWVSDRLNQVLGKMSQQEEEQSKMKLSLAKTIGKVNKTGEQLETVKLKQEQAEEAQQLTDDRLTKTNEILNKTLKEVKILKQKQQEIDEAQQNTDTNLIVVKQNLNKTNSKLETVKNDQKEVEKALQKTNEKLGLTSNRINNTVKDVESLRNEQNQMASEIDELQESVAESSSSVPVGFIYVQLPYQPTPASLWPQFDWRDISSDYSGLFFRVLGGNSAAFGSNQNEASPRLIEFHNLNEDNSVWDQTNLLPDNHMDDKTWRWWSTRIFSGGSGGVLSYLSFRMSNSNEVRPKNTAVKIWKRV